MTRNGLIGFLVFAIFAVSTYPTSISQAADGQEIRNCVNVKTGKARLVTSKTNKCKKRERLVKIVIPQIDETLISIVHSGNGAPIDFTIGHDGDFYLDKYANQIYGPRENGLWGNPINLTGEPGIRGSGLISGKGSPALFDGSFGDFYIDLDYDARILRLLLRHYWLHNSNSHTCANTTKHYGFIKWSNSWYRFGNQNG